MAQMLGIFRPYNSCNGSWMGVVNFILSSLIIPRRSLNVKGSNDATAIANIRVEDFECRSLVLTDIHKETIASGATGIRTS